MGAPSLDRSHGAIRNLFMLTIALPKFGSDKNLRQVIRFEWVKRCNA